mgnify:CR=1 FL=1
MCKLLEGKVALITGGSSGIGAATVLIFAREGAKVAILDLNKEGGEKVVAEVEAAGGEALALQGDISDFSRAEAVVGEVVDHFGTLDILVNNAGINRDKVIWKMDEEVWDAVIATDLKGVFNYTRATAPLFREKKGGSIVSVSSINGLRGKFGQSNYSAAKAGVIGLSKTVARELGRATVNVNVVCPGLIATDMIKDMPDDFKEKAKQEIVINRIGTPEDVGEVIAFLASDRARHITGEVIKVDGGQDI